MPSDYPIDRIYLKMDSLIQLKEAGTDYLTKNPTKLFSNIAENRRNVSSLQVSFVYDPRVFWKRKDIDLSLVVSS